MKVRSIAALSLLAAAPLVAQQKVTKDAPVAGAASTAALPSAQSIVDRFVTAIGGKAALSRVSSMHATGTFEMPAQGLKGDLDLTTARPNKVAMKISVPGLGDIVQGTDGGAAWSVNPMQGPHVLEGKELEQFMEESDFDNLTRTSPSIVSMETVEKTTLGGQPCYKVKVTRKSGAVSFDCYSVDTGLLVGSTATRETQMGTIETTNLVDGYTDVNGVKVATKTRVQAMGSEQVITFTNVEFNKADAAAFARPAAIDSLTKQGKP